MPLDENGRRVGRGGPGGFNPIEENAPLLSTVPLDSGPPSGPSGPGAGLPPRGPGSRAAGGTRTFGPADEAGQAPKRTAFGSLITGEEDGAGAGARRGGVPSGAVAVAVTSAPVLPPAPTRNSSVGSYVAPAPTFAEAPPAAGSGSGAAATVGPLGGAAGAAAPAKGPVVEQTPLLGEGPL